tara:strand:+ start:2066 stop:2770 length:705 start_codon:yes stop_codon:yes gene_type:complete
MNQIISQHGWGLDHNVWIKLKNQFIQKNWKWQDNERGYFKESYFIAQWIKDNTAGSKKIAICHSLGIHLMEKKILEEATHIVLINSFHNFIPMNTENKIMIKTLKRMEKKINSEQILPMLKEFIQKSFMPNEADINFKNFLKLSSEDININMLLNDFQKLYLQNQYTNLFSKHAEVLIIKSKKDSILKENSCDEFIEILNDSQIKRPKLVQLHKQGHILHNIDIGKIITDWLEI